MCSNGKRGEETMPVILEVIMVSAIMILSFFAVFLLIFLVAMMLLPVEKSLSKMVWEITAPQRPVTKQPAGFKGFSEKHK